MDRKVVLSIAFVACGVAVMAFTMAVLTFGISTDHLSMGNHDPLDEYGSLYLLGADGTLTEIGPDHLVDGTDTVVVGKAWANSNQEALNSNLEKWVSSGAAVAALDSNAGIFDSLKGSVPLSFDPDAQVNDLCKRSTAFCLSLSCSGGSDWKQRLSSESWKSTEKADSVRTNERPSCISTSVFDDGEHPATTFTDIAYLKTLSKGEPYMVFHGTDMVIVYVDTFFYHISFADVGPGRASMRSLEMRSDVQDGMRMVDSSQASDRDGEYRFMLHTSRLSGSASWQTDKGSVLRYDEIVSKTRSTDVLGVTCPCSDKSDQAHASYGFSYARMQGGSVMEWASSLSSHTADGLRHAIVHMSLRSSLPIPAKVPGTGSRGRRAPSGKDILRRPRFRRMDARLSAKFPFLKEASAFVAENNVDLESLLESEVMSPARIRGRERVLDAISSGEVEYKPLMKDYDCLMEVMSYPYARMLVSMVWDRYLTKRYALGEAVRMNKVLSGEDHQTILKVSEEMGFEASTDSDGVMHMRFADYLMLSSRMKSVDWKLINCDVRDGMVFLPKEKFNRLMQNALQDKIESELPLMPPDDMRQYLERDAAVVKLALDEAKMKMSPTRGEGMKDEYLPPCVKHLLEASLKGINLPHSGRFALVTFMCALGLDYDSIIRIFSESPDFDESKSEYQIKHITGELNGTDPYTPPECKTMKTNGLCFDPDGLCE